MTYSSGVSPSLHASPIRDFISSFSFRERLQYRGVTNTWGPKLNAQDFQRIRHKLELTQDEIGHVLGYSLSSVKRWEKGYKPSQIVLLLYAVLDHLESEFFELLALSPGERVHLLGGTLREFRTACITEDVVAKREVRARASDIPREFDSEALTRLLKRHSLTRHSLADTLGLSFSAVDKWFKGPSKPRKPTQILLRLLWRDGPAALLSLQG